MKQIFRCSHGLICALVLCMVQATFGQNSTLGAIRGQVTDDKGASISGAIVTAVNPATDISRKATSGEDGQYRVVDLQPGEYNVTVEAPGFSKLAFPNVTLAADRTIALDARLKVGTVNEVIEVSGNIPMLEAEKPAQAVNIGGDLQRSLPLSGRHDYSDFLEATPGVNSYVNPQSGGAIYSLRGSSIESHAVLLDGGDMTSFRQARPDYIALSHDALEDTQIKIGGGDASAPLAEGLIINVAAKNGTNRVHGAVSGFLGPAAWNGSNNPNGQSNTSSLRLIDASIGGPILHDRLWYFGTFRKVERNLGIARTSTQISLAKALLPDYSPFDNSFQGTSYLGKLSYKLSDRHYLSGYLQYDDYPTTANDSLDTSNVQVQRYGGWGYSGRLTSGWSSQFSTQIAASYNNKALNSSLSAYNGYLGKGPSIAVYTSAALSSGLLTGSGQQLRLNNIENGSLSPGSKWTISADANWMKSGFAGEHQIQFGVWLQPHMVGSSTSTYSNNGNALEEDVLRSTVAGGTTSYTLIPFHKRVYDNPTLVTASVVGRDNAFYLQDVWHPIRRLTITAGIRFDFVGFYDRLVKVQTQSSMEVGPRFGATYALTSDNNNIIRGSWGRVAELVSAFSPPTLSSSTAGRTDYYDNNLDGIFETVRVTPGSTTTRTDRQLDPNLHQPFVEDWTIGYRRQLPGQISIDVGFDRRYYKDRPAQVEVNEVFSGNVFQGYKDVNFNDIFLITNDKWNWYKYSSVDLFVTKRARWGNLVGSYVRAWRSLQGTWQPHDPASFIQPGFFADDKCLGIPRTAATNSLSGTADTFGCTGWQDHTGRLAVNINLPFKLIMSNNYTVQSGLYTGPVTYRIPAFDPAFGPASVTLSNGRVVSNPLATTFRFAGTDRGSAQVKAPARNEVDVRLGRSWGLWRETSLETTVDIYNLLNGGSPERFMSTAAQLNTSTYLAPQSLQQPRSFQLQARFTF